MDELNRVTAVLMGLATEHRETIVDSQRLESILRANIEGYDREIFMAVSAARNGIVEALISEGPGMASFALLDALAGQLARECGFSTFAARWAVETWNTALGDYTSKESSGKSVYDERFILQHSVMLRGTIDDKMANEVSAQLLLLSVEDPDREIRLLVNSRGGSVAAGMAIYDTMEYISGDVATYGMGIAAGVAQFLLAAGTPGKRHALRNTQIMMQQPSAGIGGTEADIAIQAELYRRHKREMAELTAQHTGKPVERILADFDQTRWFTAQEALKYGFVDHVLSVGPDEQNAEMRQLERSLEENRRKLRGILPEAPSGLDRAVREQVSKMVALRFSPEPGDLEAVNKARPMVGALSDGLSCGAIPRTLLESWPEQCWLALEKVDDARFYCIEGEGLRCFCTLLAGDILLGGDGGGSKLDPRRHLGEFYPLDWL